MTFITEHDCCDAHQLLPHPTDPEPQHLPPSYAESIEHLLSDIESNHGSEDCRRHVRASYLYLREDGRISSGFPQQPPPETQIDSQKMNAVLGEQIWSEFFDGLNKVLAAAPGPLINIMASLCFLNMLFLGIPRRIRAHFIKAVKDRSEEYVACWNKTTFNKFGFAVKLVLNRSARVTKWEKGHDQKYVQATQTTRKTYLEISHVSHQCTV